MSSACGNGTVFLPLGIFQTPVFLPSSKGRAHKQTRVLEENKVDLHDVATPKGLFLKKTFQEKSLADLFSFRRGVWLIYFHCVGGEQQLTGKR